MGLRGLGKADKKMFPLELNSNPIQKISPPSFISLHVPPVKNSSPAFFLFS
jgi:hypothetical protein